MKIAISKMEYEYPEVMKVLAQSIAIASILLLFLSIVTFFICRRVMLGRITRYRAA
jgi:hypothetical protein